MFRKFFTRRQRKVLIEIFKMLKNFRNVYHGSPQSQWIHGQEKSGRYQAPPLLLFFQWSRNMCCCLPNYIGEDMLKSIHNCCVQWNHTPWEILKEEPPPPPNAFEFDEYKMVKTFITTCAEYYGLPNQQPWEEEIRTPPIYLAASHSKKHVCRVYKEASHEKFVSTSVFYDMWKNMSSIRIRTP